MFGKEIVFGLLEMIQKKKKKKSEDRVLGFGFGLRVGSGTAARVVIERLWKDCLRKVSL